MEHYEALEGQLEAHISHTRHLKLSGYFLTNVIKRLVLPTPILESISLSHYGTSNLTIPDNLFNCTAPSLTSLKLNKYDISWKSPLLKRLRILEILELSANARPELNDWLDALNEMSQLKDLSLRFATPVAPLLNPPISRTVTLPSLTYFYIKASAKDCALALAHLVLPTLARLHVYVESHYWEGEDVLLMIPYIVRKVCVLQDIEPIRSILIAREGWDNEVLTWTTPGADGDVKACGPAILDDMSHSTCFLFAAKGVFWNDGVDAAIFDALLTLLPTNSVLTLTTRCGTRLSKEFWISNAPRLPLLEQARLGHSSVGAFLEMLAEDTPPDGPRLPSLTRLILFDVTSTVLRSYHFVNMLIKRVEQGIQLECLDLRTCVTTKLTIQLLAEILVDIQEPLYVPPMEVEEVFNWYDWYGGICYENEVKFDDRHWQGLWYCDIDNSVDRDGDDDGDDDSDDSDDSDDGDGGDDGDDGDGGEDGEDEGEDEMDYEMG